MQHFLRSVRFGSMAARRALWLTALLAALARTVVHAAGPVVRCEPCDAGALGQCKPLPRDCTERVREPGCGCCLTCALREGQACGVYTGRCGAGLRCLHRPGESKPLQALLEGRGVCTSAKKPNTSVPPVPPLKTDNPEKPVEDHITTTTATVSRGVLAAKEIATVSEAEASEDGQRTEGEPLLHTKLGIIQMEEFKQRRVYKVEPVAKGVHPDNHNFSLESKRETEYGPCRREMESILKSLKITSVLNPRFFRIPNCDRKGFYKKKQCRPSKGHKRGQCWCVDKYGQSLPGYEGKELSQVHCYNQETK
ncbi:insulin-like growth factor-binding protein 3 [Trichomycterus rosablanca]|uniref:insulin-like growth factor-binding protein 3 n=1 Tax=Trichomycterus rosablanca TaxID=2290929 RepID=UPI002F355E08